MSEGTEHSRFEVAIAETGDVDQSIAGLAFLALATQFLIVIMLSAAMVEGYDFAGGAISDLGTFPETALIFNASLVIAGGLNVLGSYYLYRMHGRRWLHAIYVLAGVGAIGAGIFPLDAGGLHSVFAVIAFVFINLQAVGTGTWLSGPMRVVAIVAGLVGLAFVVVMAVGDAGNPAVFGPINHGGAERLIVYPVMLWLVAFGGYLLALRETDGRADLLA